MKGFSHITASLVTLLLMVACATVRPVPVQTTTNVQTTVRDSIRWKDSTIYVQVPIERYVDVVPVYDTLRLETSLARADAYVDTTTHTLKGHLENKRDSIRTIIKYRDRVIETVRDSLVVTEKPIEVEVPVRYVPSFYKWCLAWSIISLLLLTLWLYLKFFR